MRQYALVNNGTAEGISQAALQTIAHLDAYLAIIARHNQQGTIVVILLADAPVPPQLVAIIGDVVAAKRGQRHDDQLVTGLLFMCLQLCRQPCLHLG